MWYSYKLVNGNEVGWYQCDVEDFKKLWILVEDEISCCMIKKDNGDCWLYSRVNRYGVRKDRYVGVNGWSKINGVGIDSLIGKEGYK